MILDFGKESFDDVDLKPLRDLLGAASSDKLLLTSSSQEAINQLFFSFYLDEVRNTGKNQFLVSKKNETTKALEELGVVVKTLKEDLESQITPRTALVSMELADSVTGLIHPVDSVVEICRRHKIALHVDVGSALGLMPVPLDVDFITFEGLQPGTGGLVMRRPLTPFMALQRPHASALVLLVKAAEEALESQDYMALEVTRLRNLFETRLKEAFSDLKVLEKSSSRLPTKSAVVFPGVHSDALLYRLAHEGFYAKGEEEIVSFTLPKEVT